MECCRRLRRHFHDPAITTDVIVGFPGETEEEFQESRDFLKQVQFYEMHVFKFSRRGGTRADRMENQVPEEIKTRRSEELLALEKEMSEAYREKFLGKENQVLLEEPVQIGGRMYMTGYTREYIRMAISFEELERRRISPEKGIIISGRAGGMMSPDLVEFL